MKTSLKARRRSRIRLAFIFTSTVLVAVIITSVALTAQLTGAIFTTNSLCSGTDLNLYDAKPDVYLDGGPAHPNAAGLPPGEYYVQVTSPDGTLLGTSLGLADETPVVVDGNGEFAQCYQLITIVRAASNAGPYPVAADGFDTTPNPGGEYKVWVSKVNTFDESESKTDNFKIKPGAQTGTLNVIKYYDTNTNGTQDGGEVAITGWEVKVGAQESFPMTAETKFTPVSIQVEDPGCYTAQEGDATGWIHTTPKIDSKQVTLGNTTTISFGNVCLGPGGGLTLGFWSNKNGQAIMNSTDLQHLRDDFKLRKADGSEFNPNTNAEVRSFLLGASATNMANMLSAQLIAMYLNVAHGFVNGNALLFAGSNPSGCTVPVNGAGFITVNALIADADTELDASGLVLSGNPERACMEFKKNTLDKGNNNLNFVQPPGSCPVPTLFTYTDESAPACPVP
ncbi:MAG TPA: hypothetical protein VFT08_02150 [Pyrinomonadaceae bacterium]|nr:hypothetical protein [Pyrinomonadaceae bacterium]